jgi:uncharacterized membrane protein SpoIIM required for sporulation
MDAVFFSTIHNKNIKRKIMVASLGKAIGITGVLLRLINCSLIK